MNTKNQKQYRVRVNLVGVNEAQARDNQYANWQANATPDNEYIESSENKVLNAIAAIVMIAIIVAVIYVAVML